MAKVAIVCSGGGHLTQALAIAGELAGRHEFFLCVPNFPALRQMRLREVRTIYYLPAYWGYSRPLGVMASLAVSMVKLGRIFRRERPDYVMTTGAEIAIVALLVNRVVPRCPSLFIESVSRIETPSLTGRLVYRLADRVFVQWPGLLQRYGPRAEYHGGLV